jgi:DNA-binding NarL/FixJ family response regulator
MPLQILTLQLPKPAAGPALRQRNTVPLTRAEWQSVSAFLRLSARESEIARLMLDTVPEADIATRLLIAPRTVHGHLERLYRKLGVHNRYELVIRLFNAYLLSSVGRSIDPE